MATDTDDHEYETTGVRQTTPCPVCKLLSLDANWDCTNPKCLSIRSSETKGKTEEEIIAGIIGEDIDDDIAPEDCPPLTKAKLLSLARRSPSFIDHRIYCAEIELRAMLKPEEKLTIRSAMRRYSRNIGIHVQGHWPKWVGPVQRPMNPFEMTDQGKFRMARAFSTQLPESDKLILITSVKAGLSELLAGAYTISALHMLMGAPLEGPTLLPLEGISIDAWNQSYETREFCAIVTGLLAL